MTNFKLSEYLNFYHKYKNIIFFNKNLILSGIAAFFAGSIFTQLYAAQQLVADSNSNNLLNAVTTLSVEYGVHIPLFATLFYLDNRPEGFQTDKKRY